MFSKSFNLPHFSLGGFLPTAPTNFRILAILKETCEKIVFNFNLSRLAERMRSWQISQTIEATSEKIIKKLEVGVTLWRGDLPL